MEKHIVVFVCEHGAAKSILAAAHFNQIAARAGLNLRAVARGTNPDSELSPQTLQGLFEDGVPPTESVPQKLTVTDLRAAERVVSFCDFPAEYSQGIMIEHWEDVPPVSESYATARDVILKHIHQMLKQ